MRATTPPGRASRGRRGGLPARVSTTLDEGGSTSRPDTRGGGEGRVGTLALGALALFLMAGLSQMLFVDPDMWHEMALFREALTLGRMPLEDRFAYTPTVTPSIHHEWGTGAVLYMVATRTGLSGILALKYVLSALIAAGCIVTARKRGAGLPTLCPLAIVAIFMSWIGFTTIRAQVFTLLFTVVLLFSLDRDREGRRGWILPWLVVYLLWVNLHGGFVVGVVLLGLHTIEQGLRRQPVRHLLAVLLAMGGLALVNPYGVRYVVYLAHALSMDRPDITEWAPIWTAAPQVSMVFGLSTVLVLYAAHKPGVRRAPGLILVAFLAVEALLHQRHLSLYAIAWVCIVPAVLNDTLLGGMLQRFWSSRPRTNLALWVSVGVIGLSVSIAHRPWILPMPANPGEHPLLVYPVGAVAHLEREGFEGNLMVPFTTGAYVSWKLHPAVRVSIDGRYEVAYAPGVFETVRAFYAGDPGWAETLERYPTDAVLLPVDAGVAGLLGEAEGWERVYVDDAYEVHARTGSGLRVGDRRGETLRGSFP